MCRDCGRHPVALGCEEGLCQSCEIAHIEDARFLEEVEATVFAIQMAQALGLSGEVKWL